MKAKNRIAACTLCLMAVLALCLPLHADYHYASHEGSNEYPYTSWVTAANLIQDAVDAASPHDTVYIGAGEWYEAVATEVHDSLAIIGMGIDSTFCYTDEYHVPVMTIDYNCSVEGITFKHLDNWKCLYARTYASVIIKNCKFNNSFVGINATGGTTEIADCIFDSCGIAIFIPIWVANVHINNNLILNSWVDCAIRLEVISAIVQNNIILNQPLTDIVAISWSVGNFLMIRNNVVGYGRGGFGASSKCYNNVAINFNLGANPFGIRALNGDTLFNNILVGNNWGIDVDGDDNVISYNTFWRNEIDLRLSGHEVDSTGNIFCNPMLISEDDFHLQAYSPLIDAGHPDYLDVDGTRSDIGAYGGPYGCSYTYLDLAPQIPDSINATIDTNVVTLIWHMNEEADFNRYQVFRDTISGFEPTIFDIIAEPDTSFYIDADIEHGIAYYYRLTSVDNQGNVSDYSDEVAVIPTYIPGFVDDGLPKYTVIESAYPNPANSQVTIVYSASNLGPQPPQIELKIFDIQGRIVKTLVHEKKPAGTYRVVWDGTNESGEPVASGNYIAKVLQWGQSRGDFPVKIALVK